MHKINTDKQFGVDSDPITREMMLVALQLVTNMMESDDGAPASGTYALLQINDAHLESLRNRILSNVEDKRMKFTLGDHILIYTSFYLFTKFYSEELTDHMLESMDDMDRMHLDEPEILQLRFYREEMLRMMQASKERFAALPSFSHHIETLETAFPVITS